MKTKKRNGFTLIELMTGMVAGMIVLLAAGSVLIVGNRYWDKAWDRVHLQRDGSYAMLKIGRSIRGGISAELESGGKGIKIYRQTNWIRFFLDGGNNDLKCEIEGGTPQTVVESNIADIEFTLDANRVDIGLKLGKDNFHNHFVSSVMMRNYGG